MFCLFVDLLVVGVILLCLYVLFILFGGLLLLFDYYVVAVFWLVVLVGGVGWIDSFRWFADFVVLVSVYTA